MIGTSDVRKCIKTKIAVFEIHGIHWTDAFSLERYLVDCIF